MPPGGIFVPHHAPSVLLPSTIIVHPSSPGYSLTDWTPTGRVGLRQCHVIHEDEWGPLRFSLLPPSGVQLQTLEPLDRRRPGKRNMSLASFSFSLSAMISIPEVRWGGGKRSWEGREKALHCSAGMACAHTHTPTHHKWWAV